MLVGEEGTGKTALCSTLVENMCKPAAQLATPTDADKTQFDTALNTKPTEGVRIHDVISTGLGDQAAAAKKIRFSVWDFSGNEAYYITHPMFMSARSMYLLVFRLPDDLDKTYVAEEREGERERND